MQEDMLNSPFYFCVSVKFKIKYFLNVLINLALGPGVSLELGQGSQRKSCLCGRPSSLTAPLLECKAQISKVPRLRVLHVWGFGEARGLPELAHLLWRSCPPNPTHSTQGTKPSSHPLPCLPSYSHRSSWPAWLQPPRLLWPRPLITQDVYY